jgi:hypothetical protein
MGNIKHLLLLAYIPNLKDYKFLEQNYGCVTLESSSILSNFTKGNTDKRRPTWIY